MGCDIHCFVEKKDLKTGKWEKITGFKSDFYDKDSDYFSTDRFKNGDSILDARNYNEFAILANVRNGFGFGGCDTGDPIKPISMPKGLPDDISEEVKLKAEEWGSDGHSHSWLTIKEIKDYPADTIVKISRGLVTVEVYKEFKKTGNPYPCCGDVGGYGPVIVENNLCEKYQEEHPEKSVYTKIEWSNTAKDTAPWLFGEGLSQLSKRSETDDGSDVRIVFWFDN